MKTKDFFQFIGEFGHGVFAYAISKPFGVNPDSVKKFVNRNPELFEVWKGNRTLSNVIVMKKELYKKLKIEGTPTKSTASASLSDILLVNAFLIENDLKMKWSYKPHFVLEFEKEKIGIISQNFGVAKPFQKFTRMLVHQGQQDEKEIEQLAKTIAARDKATKQKSLSFLRKRLITPQSLKNFVID